MTGEKNNLIKNIYYMLSYAFHVLKQATYRDIATEEFDNIQNLYAAILSAGIGQQLKQGLYREYQDKREDIPAVRGKIDIQGTIQNHIAHRQLLKCEYDELSENCLYNQILKTTVMLLLQSDQVDRKYKDSLKKEMLFFANVNVLNPTAIAWSNILFHRNNQTYRMLMGVCQLVIEGLLLSEEGGTQRLATFEDDQQMSQLFENFVRAYYAQKFPELHAAAKKIRWAIEDTEGTLLPEMKSDIMLTSGDIVHIIDTKFYSQTTQTYYGKNSIHSHNLYQIFTYVKNKAAELNGSSIVSGTLLYARTDDEIQQPQKYIMSGNRIDVKTLNLNCDFSEIEIQLSSIVFEFFKNLSTSQRVI